MLAPTAGERQYQARELGVFPQGKVPGAFIRTYPADCCVLRKVYLIEQLAVENMNES